MSPALQISLPKAESIVPSVIKYILGLCLLTLIFAAPVSAEMDPDFVPAVLWNRAYQDRVADAGGEPLVITMKRNNDAVSRYDTTILCNTPETLPLTISFSTPDEQSKRHGQAVAAASLPSV